MSEESTRDDFVLTCAGCGETRRRCARGCGSTQLPVDTTQTDKQMKKIQKTCQCGVESEKMNKKVSMELVLCCVLFYVCSVVVSARCLWVVDRSSGQREREREEKKRAVVKVEGFSYVP